VNEMEQLCALYKPSGSSISSEQLANCMVQAQERAKFILKLIKKTVEQNMGL